MVVLRVVAMGDHWASRDVHKASAFPVRQLNAFGTAARPLPDKGCGHVKR
jgi:hypothetical protein